MRKSFFIWAIAFFALVASSVAREQVYQKGENFADTIIKTRQNNLNFFKRASAGNNGITFGKWYVSQYMSPWRKKAINFANPINHPVSPDYIYGRKNLWMNFDIVDGQPFPLRKANTTKRGSSAFFMSRDIFSDKDREFVFTVGSTCKFTPFLNGKKLEALPDIKAAKELPVRVYKCALKKGENKLTFEMFSVGRLAEEPFYFVPHRDPAIEAFSRLLKDYPIRMATLLRSTRYYFSDSPVFGIYSALTSSDFNESDDMMRALIESALFSAGRFEDEYKRIKNIPGEDGARARIKFVGDIIAATRAESALGYDIKNVRAAMEDMKKTFPEYDKDGKLFAELSKWESEWNGLYKAVFDAEQREPAVIPERALEFKKFARHALLKNPLLQKSGKWVCIKRHKNSSRMGLPQNWQGNSTLACRPWAANHLRDRQVCDSYKDQLFVFDPVSPNSGKLLFKPSKDNIICDLDISFDGSKILFSTLDDKMYFRLDELDVKSGKTRTLTPSFNKEIDYYDGIYLPDGRLMFCSTACWVGVPCVAGIDSVANIYVMDPDAGDEKAVDSTIRQLTFEQDADWMPTLMENGRIMYTRWEYVDNSHYFSRILMHMNPDGTAQSSLYGSTSYWPNSLFYARQIPGDPNKFVGIVSGHHGVSRIGELHLFDISKGTKEDQGRVHQYPSFGRKYVAETKDELVRGRWPHIIHPYPLSQNYIIASLRSGSLNQWDFGIYLIDKFDNMTLLQSFEDSHAFEPMPLAGRQKPAEIADKTNPDLDYGYVFLNDIYQGDGLKNVPRGTVKALRILEYHYAYRSMGAHNVIANEGSWDVKRIHGTVPVAEDGSALFKVPANRPMALQPLDKDGKALALMRSWFTVMPGEVQSCVGCHEGQGMSPTSKPALASRSKPSQIKPFIAGVRGYSFIRDVQPVLDKYCAGCHDGSNQRLPNFKRGVGGDSGFPRSYLDLARYVRRSGPECNQNMLSPLEFNADTSELMQILKKGHKGVKLDDESMKILITWIDLNVPCYGTWSEVKGGIKYGGDKMRMKYLAKYANRHEDQNAITYDGGVQKFVRPSQPKMHAGKNLKVDGFPFDAQAAAKMIESASKGNVGFWSRLFGGEPLPKELEADIDGEKIRFVLVPAGSYVMGSNTGYYDEGPAAIVKVASPFYMSRCEVSNAQYAKFDSLHNSGYQDRQWKDHVDRGYPANLPNQPVVRVSWNEAVDYCAWLSKKLGVGVGLPSQKQWEWAARAGTASDFWFGKSNFNYGNCENLADFTIRDLSVDGVDPQPRVDDSPLNDYTPHDDFAYDGSLTAAEIGSYKPNAFGLCDMLGNVSEWTSDDYTQTLFGKKVEDKKTVRGGSWRDRAKRARVTFRRDYHPWQKVYNVGVRLVINDAAAAAKRLKAVPPSEPAPLRNTKIPLDNIPHN